MGYKAAVQVLKQADVLKAKLCKNCDLLNDSEIWVNQQQLQTIYHQVLVLDLEYALDKKVEQELWTLGFKNQISTLQELAKDKKNPKRQDSQALLSWCLEAASGFYLTLLQELCTTFDLDLPFRRIGTIYGQLKTPYTCEQITVPQSSSCLYICQYCLVHLGDIARYRNQRQQAENFYRQAILVSPTSGQPYNQLALLEASQGNKLSTVFHYIRAIAVKNPFPVSSTNLSTTLSSAMDKDDPITDIQTKMSVNKLIRLFLHIHGLLRSTTDLDQAEIGVKSINATLTALVATQSFTSDKLIKMVVINMYALWNITGIEVMKVEELTKDEQKACQLILDLIAGSLSAFLLPIYTLKNDETLLDYYALPAIKLICSWIEKSPEILSDAVFTNRLQIWPSFCKLLNNIQDHLKEFNYQPYETTPLTEDRELQGFLPLSKSFKSLNFKSDILQTECPSEKHIRAKRLIDFGVWLTSHKVNNTHLIISKTDTTGGIVFEPGCIQPDPTDQLLELMKSVNVTELVENKKSKVIAVGEKRTGILKPQGSLERSREEREQIQSSETIDLSVNGPISKTDPTKMKRIKQNVALQSIFKKMEENKQVKFSEETTDKENEKAKLKQQHQQQQQPPPPLKPPITATPILPQQQYRTQTFNQNHPGLSTNLHQDFFTSTVQTLPKIGEITQSQNLYFQNSELKNNLANTLSKIPQTMQYTVPPPPQSVPMRMVPNIPTPSNNQFNAMPFRNGPWSNDDRSHTTGNWWPNQAPQIAHQQKDNFQQSSQPQQQPPHTRDSFMNTPFGSNLSFGQNHATPMSVDYNQQTQNTGVFNMWGNAPRAAPMNSFSSVNQSMSMRQAMLNETKHMGPIGSGNTSTGNTLPKHPDTMQHPNTPGYSLFDTNWSPSLPIRQPESTTQRTVSSSHHSLFSGPSHSSLQQLLEQQNQFQKCEK